MIRGMLIENGVVVNVAVFETVDDLFDGWVEVADRVNVGPGYIDNGDGTFSAPPVA